MSVHDNAGSAVLLVSGSNVLMNALTQVDTIVSILVGCLSIVGIGYSIVWHRARIRMHRQKKDE